MGIFDKLFGGKKDAHHDHEHFDCCGKTYHDRSTYNDHRRSVHGDK